MRRRGASCLLAAGLSLAAWLPSPARADQVAAAPAAAPAPCGADCPQAGRIWDARQRRWISHEALLEVLKPAEFILLGEVHDNVTHHRRQLEVLRALLAAGRRPALALEQLDREGQGALDQALAAGQDAATVAAAAGMDRKAWPWAHYGPLLEQAVQATLPITAANLSRAKARQVGASGRMPAELGDWAPAWTPQREAAAVAALTAGHCGQLPAALAPRMVLAQRARDATLAQALLSHQQRGVVLITGNGHVRQDLGVPLYLRAMVPAARIVAVGLTEIRPDATGPDTYQPEPRGDTALPPFDYLWFEPAATRPDPCAGFQLPGAAGAAAPGNMPAAAR